MLRDDLFSMEFLKKTVYHGDYHHMRFLIAKKDDTLEVSVYPGPFAIEFTPEDQIEKKVFDFTKEGYEQAKDWLDEMYKSRDWKEAMLDWHKV